MGRGVAVVSRVPGFCAYRMLRNGDVLLSMTVGQTTVTFERTDDLMESLANDYRDEEGNAPAPSRVEVVAQGHRADASFMVRPERMMAPKATCTSATPASAFARSCLSVPA